jgi:hypothetical protein
VAIAGVFYVLTWRSALLGIAYAAITALVFGAIASFFVPWGLAALTARFCFGGAGLRPAEGLVVQLYLGPTRRGRHSRGAPAAV